MLAAPEAALLRSTKAERTDTSMVSAKYGCYSEESSKASKSYEGTGDKRAPLSDSFARFLPSSAEQSVQREIEIGLSFGLSSARVDQ